MRTTVTLDKVLVHELMRYSGAKTKTAAVSQAVKEQIRRAKLRILASRLGRIEVDDKAITDGNNADLERAKWLGEIGVNCDPKQ
jgi:hypothetical protein